MMIPQSFLALALLGLTNAATLVPRAYNFPDTTCDQAKQDTIKLELEKARTMVEFTVVNPSEGVYYDTFFAQSLRNDPNFKVKIGGVYARMDSMLNPTDNQYTFTIQCDDSTTMCRDGYIAHMNDGRSRMNFCNSFFNEASGIKATQTILNDCATIDLRAAQRTRSAVIVHELTHTSYAMKPEPRTLDYAYGFNNNYQLALGTFDRSCAKYKKANKVLCPDPNDATKESICPAERSQNNADTYSFIAAGIYFSKSCNRAIPLPNAPPPKLRRSLSPNVTALQKRACADDDAIPFDDAPDEE